MDDKSTSDKDTAFQEPSIGIKKKVENFWYHYKAQTIIAIVAILTVAISTGQLLTKDKIDYYTIYAGPQILAVQDISYIQRAIAGLAEDYNGDGEVKIELKDIVMLTDEEIAAAKDDGAVFNAEFIRQSLTEYYQQIIVGDAVILFLSPSLYQIVYESDGFVPLADIFGEDLPAAAYDDCGIILSKTDFGNSFNGIDDLPDDTILCIRRISTLKKFKGNKKTEAYHTAYVELFRAMVAYKAE